MALAGEIALDQLLDRLRLVAAGREGRGQAEGP